jgi:N-acetylglutamate synthase-like GNAT family acetyltransferase
MNIHRVWTPAESATPRFQLRRATVEDVGAIKALIERSAREVGTDRYTAMQMEAALRGAFGVDTQLIRDGTYWVAEHPDGSLIGCGGWSRRRTLFGGDNRTDRESGELDPQVDAAKIRAFFVHPQHLRMGIARALLNECEAEARSAGFAKLELIATLTGVPFYAVCGYTAAEPFEYQAAPGVSIGFVPMTKRLPA